MRELIVVGVGPGAPELATPAAAADILGADCVVAAPRHMALLEHWGRREKIVALEKLETAFAKMEAETGSVAVAVSGDPGLYSLLPALKRRFPGVPLRVQPGISSLQALCAAAGEAWQDAAILSGHGRPLSAAKLLNTVERNRLTALFCDNVCSPDWACKSLAGAAGDLGGRVTVAVGERLSYNDARIEQGRPSDFMNQTFDSLALMLIKNSTPWTPPSRRPEDRDFDRAPGIPMTREDIRSVILDRLGLTPDAVFWDIGAGTGSVSAAAALECPDGDIHAVEQNPEAVRLLERNRDKFHLHNMRIHAGRALSVMEAGELPEPTHVFIGGSGGELREILSRLAGHPLRVVAAAVTLDTLNEAAAALRGWEDFSAIQLSASVSRALPGGALLMEGRNPVTLLCAGSGKLKLSGEVSVP